MSHCPKEVHVGDVGTALRLKVLDQDDAAVDLSAATTLEILVSKPDGSVTSTAATSLVDPVDSTESLMQFLSITTTFDVPGWYNYQGHIVLASGEDLHTDIIRFEVHANL